jgi:putative ABC transport system substrate-binding protein
VLVTNTTAAALAAKQATATIPIVVAAAGDLVEDGLVASIERPGGNLTRQLLRDLELAGKRVELLKEAVPHMVHMAVLTDPNTLSSRQITRAFEAEARALGVRLQRLDAGTPEAIAPALTTLTPSGADARMILESAMFRAHRRRILDLALTHRLPTVCGGKQYAEAGCLVSYSPNHNKLFRPAAVFVDKILKGAKPADLPVERPSTLELCVNLKTAQALGLTVPPSLLFQADVVLRQAPGIAPPCGDEWSCLTASVPVRTLVTKSADDPGCRGELWPLHLDGGGLGWG